MSDELLEDLRILVNDDTVMEQKRYFTMVELLQGILDHFDEVTELIYLEKEENRFVMDITSLISTLENSPRGRVNYFHPIYKYVTYT